MTDFTSIFSSTAIRARTGRPAASLTRDELVALAAGVRDRLGEEPTSTPNAAALGPPPSFGDPRDLHVMGWGIVWPPEADDPAEILHLAALKQALQPLVDLRAEQMAAPAFDFRYGPGQTARDFLWAHEITPGNMEPDVVPYYLLLVGSPAQIPWSFQYELDAEYAVGRLWFDDVADCRAYVNALVRRWQGTPSRANRELLVLAPEQDHATLHSRAHLVDPLLAALAKRESRTGFASTLLGQSHAGSLPLAASESATRENLLARLRHSPPALLFTASHGIEYDKGDSQQQTHQGALLLQDWPGHGPPQPAHLLDAAAVQPIDLDGTMVVSFGCFSAGTPQYADWLPAAEANPLANQLAHAPFVARLPQAMLARGASAFVGHVSRAWMSSFLHLSQSVDGAQAYAVNARPQVGALRELLLALMLGQRVGHATDPLNLRWVQLTAAINDAVASGAAPEVIAALWLTRADGRGWVVLGDPAARLNLENVDTAT